MLSNRYPLIAREGWPFLACLLILAVSSQFLIGTFAFIICFILLLIFTFLFRDPPREIPSHPLAVLSPVYGVVTLVEEAEEVRFNTRSIRIQIHTRFRDVYSLRSPIEGKICQHWCSSPDANEPRRHFDFHIKSDEGDNIITAIRLPNIVRWFHVYFHPGERVGHGQRCGYFFFGTVVDIFLPLECKVQVEEGQEVESGSTVLARLIHSEAASVIQDKLE